MQTKFFLGLSVLSIVVWTGIAGAQELNIEFPIVELGSCESKESCFAYCEEAHHFLPCTTFGTQHGLIEEHQKNLGLLKLLSETGGPGGCDSEIACEAYCSDMTHINVCLAFAEEHSVMDPSELEEAKKVQTALAAGATLPGGCTNKQSCETYCAEVSHMEECMTFAEAAGFMNTKELEQARRMLPLMQSGEMPGGCTSKETCETYCQDIAHTDECADFGVKSGFMTPEEAEQMKSSGSFTGPGGCASKEECMTYCQNPEHLEECRAMGGNPMDGENQQNLQGSQSFQPSEE